jgi:hypothetical protein
MAVSFFGAAAITARSIAAVWMKRLDSRHETPSIEGLDALTRQLTRIESAVDAMSVEVERITEAQRFLVRLQSEGEQHQLAPPSRTPEGRVITPH